MPLLSGYHRRRHCRRLRCCCCSRQRIPHSPVVVVLQTRGPSDQWWSYGHPMMMMIVRSYHHHHHHHHLARGRHPDCSRRAVVVVGPLMDVEMPLLLLDCVVRLFLLLLRVVVVVPSCHRPSQTTPGDGPTTETQCSASLSSYPPAVLPPLAG